MESPAAAVIQCQHEYTFAEASLQELMLRGHMHIHVLCRSSNHNRFLTSVEGPGLRLETHGLDFLLKEAPCILPREAQPNTACCSHLQSCGHGKGRYRVWVLVPCALSSQSRHQFPVSTHRSQLQMYRTYCSLLVHLYMVQKEKQNIHNKVCNLVSVWKCPSRSNEPVLMKNLNMLQWNGQN